MKYTYEIKGTAVGGPWQVRGEVWTERQGDFKAALDLAAADAFDQLTHGKAEYGFPGKGCKGPYYVTSMLIEEVRQ